MPPDPLRLFVAIYPPEPAARALLRALRELNAPSHRETPLDQVHMTLQFIGNRTPNELDEVRRSVQRSAAGLGPFELTPTRLFTLPQRGRPRLIAAETDAHPTLLEIQRRLAHRLARTPREKPGDRFRPHLTLCRFTASARPRDVDEPIKAEPFPVEAIHLMKSTLRPEGAVHSEVARIDLTA
jgi:RNA 2',3'-cyclic 3'-phosphodiesterase